MDLFQYMQSYTDKKKHSNQIPNISKKKKNGTRYHNTGSSTKVGRWNGSTIRYDVPSETRLGIVATELIDGSFNNSPRVKLVWNVAGCLGFHHENT